MDCWREKPQSKTELGKLIIDVKKATVTYEGKNGRDYAPITELKQVDLRTPDTKVVFHALDPKALRYAERGFDGATRLVEIMRMTPTGNQIKFISLHCLAPKWRIWYWDPVAFTKKKVFITDPEIMVDALVHCVDRASGRDPVHDPDVDHRWATEEVEVASAPFQSGGRGPFGKEWAAAEKEDRRIAKTLAKAHQLDKLAHDVKIPH
ncbi:hypothetical protein B5807_11792 [Epicoccum nigrum]|uniref:Uncharacterized protein n=1 Tax=Epicoccum nigrum TaxID=105696 RepID=A0A1Y2LIG3_EPING|nr:hypothetical protein B5807_11792 [Epicoccum nigrum]